MASIQSEWQFVLFSDIPGIILLLRLCVQTRAQQTLLVVLAGRRPGIRSGFGLGQQFGR